MGIMSKLKFCFEVTIGSDSDDVDDLGKDLVLFLQESFFNGEDVFEVRYVNCEEIE